MTERQKENGRVASFVSVINLKGPSKLYFSALADGEKRERIENYQSQKKKLNCPHCFILPVLFSVSISRPEWDYGRYPLRKYTHIRVDFKANNEIICSHNS